MTSSPDHHPERTLHSPSLHNEHTQEQLRTLLRASVHLRVFALYEAGGPTVADIEHALAFGYDLVESKDGLVSSSTNEEAIAEQFNALARFLAVFSFLSDGVRSSPAGPFDAREILSGFFGPETVQAYCRSVTARYFEQCPQVWATCHPLGKEQVPHVTNVTRWLAQIGQEGLDQLQEERYSNLVPAPQGEATTDPAALTSHLLRQLATTDPVVAQMIKEALVHQRPLPVCRLSPTQVQAWREAHPRSSKSEKGERP